MSLSDDRVERFRIRTRSYTKQIRKQDDEIKRNESKPAWIYPRTPDHAKDLLTKRIEAVLPHLQTLKFNREWQAMNRNNKPSFAPLLCFAVDTLKLRSVRKVPEQQTESTIKRAQFLELFSIKIENKEWDAQDVSSKVSTSSKSTSKFSKTSSQSSGSTKKASSHAKLHEICMDTFKSPMAYESVEITNNNKAIWATKVTHPSSDQVYGYAESKNRVFSRELAAQHAMWDLVESFQEEIVPDEKSESILEQKEVESHHTEDELPASINVSDDLDSEFDKQLLDITFVQEHALSAMEQRFEHMLTKQLNTMTEFFDKRIKMTMDETIETTILPMIENTVKQEIITVSNDYIQAEILKHLDEKLADKELITKMTQSVTNQVQNDITSSVISTVNHNLDTSTKNSDSQIKKTADNCIKLINDEFEQAKQNFTTLSRKEISQLIDNRHDIKTTLKNQYDDYMLSMKQEQTV